MSMQMKELLCWSFEIEELDDVDKIADGDIHFERDKSLLSLSPLNLSLTSLVKLSE